MSNNIICGNVGTNCIIQLPGECVSYTGNSITYPLSIPKNTNINSIINTINTYLTSISTETVYYRTDITSELSDNLLNNYYPSAKVNTKVICPNISTGGLLYWKVNNTTWVHLCMTCGSVTPLNPLVVNAGVDQTLPGSTTIASLSGTATTDESGSISSTLWEIVSGPNSPIITNPNNLSTTVTGLISGNYILKLTVSDTLGRTVNDELNINVGIPSQLRIDLGADQNLPSGTTSTTVTATLNIPDGVTVNTQTWSIVS